MGSRRAAVRRAPALLGLAAAIAAVAVVRAADPPAEVPVPQWVSAVGVRGRAILTWIPDPRHSLVRIQRRPRDTPGFKPVGESAGNSFSDTAVEPGQSYVYRLVGVDAAGNASPPSPEATTAIPAEVRKAATPPRWEGGLVLEGGVGLKWSSREGEDIIAVNVYRRGGPGEQFALAGSARGTSFFDRDVEAGRSYEYALTALDGTFRETAFSEPLTVTYAPPSERPDRPRAERWRVLRTRLVLKISETGRGPLFRPADVAIGPRTGAIYVADAGNNRVEVYDPGGTWKRSVGGRAGEQVSFGRLLGIGIDAEERLYAVDAASGSVLVVRPDGALERRVDVARHFPRERTGLLDVAVDPAGLIRVVDNFNHRVAVIEGEVLRMTVGGFGPAEGQLTAPGFCLLGPDGSLRLADALNGRVQLFDAAGRFVRAFGRYGQGPGGLVRPKGVASRPDGSTYVSDSWLNTVQLFGPDGGFVAALGDEEGRPLDLGSPNGMATDAKGRLYIAERLSNRIQIRELIDAP